MGILSKYATEDSKQDSVHIAQRQMKYAEVHDTVFERKFNIAIRKSTCDGFKERYLQAELREDDYLITEHFNNDVLDTMRVDESVHARIIRKIMSTSSLGKTIDYRKKKEIDRLQSIAKRNLSFQSEYMLKANLTPEADLIRKDRMRHLDQIENNPLISNLFWLLNEMEKIVTKTARLTAPEIRLCRDKDLRLRRQLASNQYQIPELNLKFTWSMQLVLIELDNIAYILPRSYILMIHNKVADLVSTTMYIQAEQGVSLEKDSYAIYLEFLSELVNLNITYKRNYYTIAKSLESLVIAETIREVDAWDNKQFRDALILDLQEEIGFDYSSSELARILVNTSVPLRHELGCMSKLLGHPLVDMLGGAQKIFDYVQKPLTIDPTKVTLLTCYIKERFIRTYILTNGKWPPVEFTSPLIHKAFVWARVLGKDPNATFITRKYGTPDIMDYLFIELGPIMKFQKLDNFIPYLKDKSLSLLRSKVASVLINKSEDSIKQTWKETRLLLMYFLRSEILTDHTKYLDRYVESENLDELLDYLVIKIIPKEKELKEMFRGFGAKTYEDRSRALVQEKNVMEFLDKYCDEQAMTLSELDLIKKLWAFRNLEKTFPGHEKIVINVDGKAWNNHFRKETVDVPMKETLDRVFQTSIFSKTQQAYEKTLFYIEDHDKYFWWEGQAGGIEGLNQDTWVVVYLAMIHTALRSIGIPYFVLEKGDDVRIVLLVPPQVLRDRPIQDIKDQTVALLHKEMGDFGHHIKVLDSYGSSLYMAFSKAASIGTIELPQVVRKIAKTHASNNTFINTLDESIGTAYSNGHSACAVSATVVSIYYVVLMWSYSYIINHQSYKKLGDNELCALLLVPNVVGGFPIIYLHSMFVRAESDLLSPFIGMTQFARHFDHTLYEYMSHFLCFKYPHEQSLKTLLKDPYSIPLDRPMLPKAFLRQSIVKPLRSVCKNNNIKELLEEVDSGEIMEKIMGCIQSCNVWQVRVLSNIYAATPDGLLDAILAKFETARSIYELLILRIGVRRADRILRATYRHEMNLQKWRVSRLLGMDTRNVGYELRLNVSSCPAELAQLLRDKLWGKPVEGVTMPPLQHQLFFTTPIQGMFDEWSVNNHFTFYPSAELQSLTGKKSVQQYCTGNKKPFLGYTTRAGTIAPVCNFIEKDTTLLKVKNLLDLISWTAKSRTMLDGTVLSSNIHELIHYVIKLYSPEPIERLAPFSARQRSGTIAHHMRAPNFRESIVPNSLSNIYQQVIGQSNSHRKFTQSAEHYYVNFLHILCYSINIIYMQLQHASWRTGSDEIWAVTTPCDYCNRSVEETPIICTTSMLDKHVLRPFGICNVGEISTKILKQSLAEFHERDVNLYGLSQDDMSFELACAGVMQEFIDETYSFRTLIQDRYTQHSMTSEQKSYLSHLVPKSRQREIGQTEIKHIPISYFVDYIIPYINLEVHKIYPNVTEQNVIMVSTTRPGSELPWFGLVEYVYRAGRLGHLLLELQRQSGIPLPNCFDNVGRSCQYIGAASYIIQLNTPITPTFVILTYYTRQDIFRHCKILMYAYARRVLKTMMTEISPYLVGGGLLGDGTAITKLILLILFCCLNARMDDPEVQQEYLEHMDYNETIELLNMRMLDDGIGEVESMDELLETYANEDLIYYVERHPNINWDEVVYSMTEAIDDYRAQLADYLYAFRVRAVVSDLAACIIRVRAEIPHLIEENDQRDAVDDDIPIARLLEERPLTITVGRQHRNTRSLHIGGTSMSKNLFSPSEYDFTDLTIRPDTSWAHRLIGVGTVSTSKFLEILRFLGIRNLARLGTWKVIGCIAEGYGGVMNLFASISHSCTFFYNTIPPNRELDAVPYLAMNSLERNNHRLLSDHIRNGFYDLSKEETIQYYTRINLSFVILTADPETSDDVSEEDYTTLLVNIAHLFLIAGSADGLLILKVMLWRSEAIHYVVGVLERYVQTLGLIRCLGSRKTGEVYLYAHQITRGADISILGKRHLPSLRNYTIIERFRHQLYEEFDRYSANDDISLLYGSPSPCLYREAYFAGLGSSGVDKMGSQLGIYLKEAQYRALFSYGLTEELRTVLLNHIRRNVRELEGFLFEHVNVEYLAAHWDPNTFSHKLALLYRILQLKGFRCLLGCVTRARGGGTCYESYLFRSYVSYVSELPARLQMGGPYEGHRRKDHMIAGMRVYPYASFMEGVKICCYFLGYFLNEPQGEFANFVLTHNLGDAM
jgi:hypothetical protein